MTAKTKPQYRLVCERCGSDKVLTDAWAHWDYETQAYVLASTQDHEWCESCDGETSAYFLEAT